MSRQPTGGRACKLDEAETRKLVDEQLRQAGWQADSETLRYAAARGRKRAGTWPLRNGRRSAGPADYVLFVGLTPVAVVEAKRKTSMSRRRLQQAKRYSRSFNVIWRRRVAGRTLGKISAALCFFHQRPPLSAPIGDAQRHLVLRSAPARQLSRALDGWYTPEGLAALLKQDETQAHQQLCAGAASAMICLRPYQQEAIQRSKRRSRAGNACCWSPWPPAPARPRSALR